MNVTGRLSLRLSVTLLLGCAALTWASAQSTDTPASTAGKPQAASGGANADAPVKPGKKPAKEQTASTEVHRPNPGGYATEAEAQAHCRGTVVWIDSDHFNHYKGSREYGRKPGAFSCEKD